MSFRIGFGTDIHRLIEGRPLVLGGVTIESELGADGHSDADVLMHAAADAVLGSLALGDLGKHFPNDDEQWRNAASSAFLKYAADLVRQQGYEVANFDSVIHLEAPKLRPHIDMMRQNVAEALGLTIDQVSIKAKTGEKVDAVGEKRAVTAQAIVMITKI